jgi:PAS domain S-box-containing protein
MSMSQHADTRTGLDTDRVRDSERERERIAELEQQVTELEALYRVTPVAFCLVDRELRYLRVNDEYAEIVARRREDIIGNTMQEVVHEMAREVAVGLVKSVLNTGRPVRNLELPGITRTTPPEERVWLLNAHPIKSDGEVVAVIGVMQNVTEVKQMERSARERLEVIESIYRNAPVALAYLGPDLRYERVNEMMAEINGVSIEDHIGKTIEEILPKDGASLTHLLRELFASGSSIRDVEFELYPPSDSERAHIYRVNIDPVRDGEGSPQGVLATILDVTEQARAERELKAANQRIAEQLNELETLYENAPMGIALVDRELRFLRVNRILAKTYGQSVDELVGQRIPDLDPVLMGQLSPHIDTVLTTGRQQLDLEIRGRHPTRPDRVYTWLSSLFPTFGAGRRIEGMIITAQNVTPLKDQQAQLEEANARLAEAQRITHMGSWEWDLLSDTLWWSDELYEIYRRSPDAEVTWNDFVDRIHPDDVSKLRTQIQETLEGGEPFWLDLRIRREDSTERILRTAARLERTEGGRPAKLIGVCQEARPHHRSPSGTGHSERRR